MMIGIYCAPASVEIELRECLLEPAVLVAAADARLCTRRDCYIPVYMEAPHEFRIRKQQLSRPAIKTVACMSLNFLATCAGRNGV